MLSKGGSAPMKESAMNRAWITGLALAGAAGSAGAAFAGVAAGTDFAAPETQPVGTPAGIITPHDRTVDYQVGAAGTVSVSVAGGSLTVVAAAGGTGWTLIGATAPGAHVEVQFTDSLQLVTFAADLVGDDVVVAVTNLAAPGAPATTVAATPMSVTVITAAPKHNNPGTTAPKAATPVHTNPAPTTPAPTAAPTTPAPTYPARTTQPAATQPAPAATTAPSGTGDDDHEDDHGDDPEEHEDD